MEFEIGDRVKVKPEECDRYVQPWRDRFSKGRAGTIVQCPSANVRGYMVEFDHGKVKYPHEWRIVMPPQDLERLELM